MQPELIILVGNIASGKSTLTKRYQSFGYIVIGRDWLRKAIGGGEYIFNPEYESTIFKTETYLLKRFMDLRKNIVVDEVGMSRKLRKKYLKLAKQYNYRTHCIIMSPVSKEESVRRRLNDNHGNTDKETWEMVWEKFNAMYQEPTREEGFDLITNLWEKKL